MSRFVIPNRIFDPAAECMPRSDRAGLQATHLRRAVEQAHKVPFYRRKFAAKNITPDAIKTIDDIRRLPFTTRKDLADAYPFGFFAVPRRELARMHTAEGADNQPLFVGYTRNDLKLWSMLCARILVSGGLTSDQLVQVSFCYGPLTEGFGLHGGIERVGAAVLPASGGDSLRQLRLLKDAQADTLVCNPSCALDLAETIARTGTRRSELALRLLHLGGERLTPEVRGSLEEQLGVLVFNNYGPPEVLGPGVAGECAARCGMHIQEDHFCVECIHPETLEPVAEGEVGELVLTSLTREACPVIRYRTGDLVRLSREVCACGRTTLRMCREIPEAAAASL